LHFLGLLRRATSAFAWATLDIGERPSWRFRLQPLRIPVSALMRADRHSRITPSCATAIVVSLLPLLYFFPATRGNLVISPDEGLIFNIPIRVAVANLLHAGYPPLWTPDIFCGMPLFGAAQAGVLFPLNWFYLAFSAPVATNLMMLSSYMVAALGAYLFARRSGSSVAGAALTSLIWQWSGFLIGQIGHTNILHTAALLPWLLWAIDGYGESGKRSRGLVLALLVAVQVFAGHQQTLVYALLFAAAYALVMWRRQAASEQVSPRHLCKATRSRYRLRPPKSRRENGAGAGRCCATFLRQGVRPRRWSLPRQLVTRRSNSARRNRRKN
jgi:hypothetical protein